MAPPAPPVAAAPVAAAALSDAERARATRLMRRALAEASAALGRGETPVGCVLALEDGGKGGARDGDGDGVLAVGANRTNASKDGTRHAELEAVDALLAADAERAAAAAAGGPAAAQLLADVELFVSVEPCIMCAAALSALGLKRVFYGCPNDKFGGCGSILRVHEEGACERHARQPPPPLFERRECLPPADDCSTDVPHRTLSVALARLQAWARVLASRPPAPAPEAGVRARTRRTAVFSPRRRLTFYATSTSWAIHARRGRTDRRRQQSWLPQAPPLATSEASTHVRPDVVLANSKMSRPRAGHHLGRRARPTRCRAAELHAPSPPPSMVACRATPWWYYLV